MRRLAAPLYALFLTLALPALAFAQDTELDKPEGTDHTLLSIFIVAAGIPLLLAILSLIDIALGKHGEHDSDH